MNKAGFAIAKNRSCDTFFTSRSSYDAPQWVDLAECSVYPTAELAQLSLLKLLKRGAYEAQLFSVTQISEGSGALPVRPINPEQPSTDNIEDPVTPIAPNTDGTEAEGDDEAMVADVENNDASTEDDLAADQLPANTPDDDEDDAAISDQILAKSKEVTSEATMGGVVGFSNVPTIASNNQFADMQHTDKLQFPALLKKNLTKLVGEYEKKAKDNQTKVYGADFDATVHACFSNLLKLLSSNTVEDLKNAQIQMSSWMSPITSLLPPEIVKYIVSGGKPPSLKDTFYTIVQNKKNI